MSGGPHPGRIFDKERRATLGMRWISLRISCGRAHWMRLNGNTSCSDPSKTHLVAPSSTSQELTCGTDGGPRSASTSQTRACSAAPTCVPLPATSLPPPPCTSGHLPSLSPSDHTLLFTPCAPPFGLHTNAPRKKMLCDIALWVPEKGGGQGVGNVRTGRRPSGKSDCFRVRKVNVRVGRRAQGTTQWRAANHC